MRKILFLFLALSFLGLNAQKRKTTKKRKAKTTKTAAAKAEVAANPASTDAAVPAAVPEVAPVPDEPLNSMSILNAKSPESFRKYRELGQIKQGDSLVSTKVDPLKYGFVEDKDILKSMVTWEIIDMNEKINQPFYHNEDGLVSQNKSLYQILLDAVNDGSIKEVYDDELFTTRLTKEQIAERTHHTVINNSLIDKINAGTATEQDKKEGTDVYQTKTENVKLLKIKGMWYIDRRDGEMKYRLLGICAMGQDPATMGEQFANKDELIDLFWVYYPDARKVLANNEVFNSKNLSANISFDDILNARRFSSIIYKVDNGLGNGVIKDYIPKDAQAQLDESDRIKNQILQMENDMWTY